MPGLSTEYWEINTSAAFRAFERIAYKDKEYKWYGESDPANKFRFAVLLGDGKLVRSNKVPLSKFKSLGVNETIQPGKQKFISAYPRSDLTHNEQAHAKRAVTL
jgi:hypothetical protein